jgi:hypothetical protein
MALGPLGWDRYRLRAALWHEAALTDPLRESSSPVPDVPYGQDHDLFCFAACAVSAVDCFHFAAYCMGAIADPGAFPLSSEAHLRSSPRVVRAAYEKVFPSDTLTSAMVTTLEAAEWKQLRELRNVLSIAGRRHANTSSATEAQTLRRPFRGTCRPWPRDGATTYTWGQGVLIRSGSSSSGPSGTSSWKPQRSRLGASEPCYLK